MLAYAVLLAPLSVAPYFLGFAGPLFGILSAILGITFLWFTYRVWDNAGFDKTLTNEKKLFGFSLAYLFSLFAVLMIDGIVFRVTGKYMLAGVM